MDYVMIIILEATTRKIVDLTVATARTPDYPNCFVQNPYYIGDGECNDYNFEGYNTEDCGFDGGDCLHPDYPNCFVQDSNYYVGDGFCDDFRGYNTEECGFDGGDCVVPYYPDCFVQNPNYIGNGVCDDNFPYNTEECGFDGGDCLD
jgi:hypothetical protein